MTLLFINGYKSEEDDYITIENVPRGQRILWPYPVDYKAESEESLPYVSKDDDKDEDEHNQDDQSDMKRKGRFLLWSYPQSPIVNMMMKTVAVNYSPTNPNDPFDFLRDSYPLPKGNTKPLDEYDYVIVGAGSAGSVLAARLTEDKPKANVLVIEAGKPEMLLSDIPALAHYLQLTDYAWPYSMEHQPGVCLGSEEQRCFWPRGKAVGGTSVTNFMLYTRGRPQDWDRIAADGNYGWSHDEVLRYYKKSEKSRLKKYKDAPHRGRDGELTVENVPFKTGLIEAFLKAGRDFGHPTVDYNAPDQFGFGYTQTMTDKGHRLSAAKAFLHPNKRRKNLHILPEARATKVIIEPQTKRAYAVEYIKNGKKYTVRCRREVILSAGPIASPQLLMLSGVGPREHLETLGIPVIADVKVGKTLYDHIGFPAVIFKLNSTNASLLEPKVATLPNLMQWLQFGDGLLTTPGTVEGIGYIKTAISEDPELVPDIELISMGASMTLDAGGAFRKSWKISDKTYYQAFGSLSGLDTWSAVPVLLKPKSKGYLELRDTNPFSHPKMYGNYLTDPKDMATLKEGIKYVTKLGESEAFKRYAPQLHLPEYPTCVTYAPGTDSYWDCAVRTMVVSLRHQIATCKMGPPNDPDAVVDPELRVYGVEGLRVVDSSIIPRPIGAHTNAPAIMIGERAADMIKKTWSNVVQ
ncbi:hypothetical protein evm_000020 [Chilo suppressalis]|nr:hypothetical protein evm_000020 [Chilo suppressalis]